MTGSVVDAGQPAVGDLSVAGDVAGAVRALRSVDPLRPMTAVLVEAERMVAAPSPFGPLTELLEDVSVSEVLVNGPGPVWVERAGTLVRSDVVIGDYDLRLLIERVLAPLGLRVDRTSPIVDARLADGSRVNVVVPPLAIDGPSVSIRRFATVPVPLSAFGPMSMSTVVARLIEEHASILIVGPTSSGKTTLINALSTLMGDEERIVCLEDTAELQLGAQNLVRLEARPANSEGVGEIPLRELVRTAMRMRPDRLVVGEVRGAEAFDLLLALTSGHGGCLATCHGAEPASALRRLETLAAMGAGGIGPEIISTLVRDGIDAVIAVERTEEGVRRVASVSVLGADGLRAVWTAEDPNRPMAAVGRLRAC